MKTAFAILLSLILSFPVLAQQASQITRWEFGVDALTLFGKNTLPDYSLFGRFLINPEGKKKAFIRTRMGYESTNRIIDNPLGFIKYQDLKLTNWTVAVGFQKEILSTSSTSFYYGGDFTYQKNSEDDFGLEGIEQENIFSYSGLTTFSIQRFTGFLGFSFKPIKEIKISFESGLFVGNENFEENTLLLNPSLEPVGFYNNSTRRVIAGFQPFYQMLITLNL